jgi:hypothetical protein
MKIIITESQYKTLLESSDNSNVVEKIMNHMGIKYDGHEFLERSYDNFGRTHDTVIFYFRLPDDDYSYYRRIHFLTRNNKVIRVDSAGDFRTIDDAFRYIPTDVLMDYFIEKGKTYLEKFLPKRYPNDNLKESVIKEDNLKYKLKQMVKSDGWESTYPLVGDVETLAQVAFDNDPMEFIDSLGLKKNISPYSTYFFNDEGGAFFSVDLNGFVEINYELSDFLFNGFNLDREGAKNVIKQWLSDRHDIKVKIRKIYL